MRTRNTVLILLLATLATAAVCTSAEADFVVTNAPPPAAAINNPSRPVAMAPIVDPGDARSSSAPTKPEGPATIHWKTAHGFGDNVPLAFACRQIVPPPVKVTFGPGANPQMLVSWKGGDTWNNVLHDAVKPIGLRLVMTYMAVEIRK
jgi:hypothetical protein